MHAESCDGDVISAGVSSVLSQVKEKRRGGGNKGDMRLEKWWVRLTRTGSGTQVRVHGYDDTSILYTRTVRDETTSYCKYCTVSLYLVL